VESGASRAVEQHGGALTHTRVWRERVELRERTKSELGSVDSTRRALSGPAQRRSACAVVYVYMALWLWRYALKTASGSALYPSQQSPDVAYSRSQLFSRRRLLTPSTVLDRCPD